MINLFYTNISNIQSFKQISYLMDYISDKRRNAVDRYLFDKDKIRSVVAESILRYILIKEYKINNSDIWFEYNDYQKPYLKYPNNNIFFNLSHSGDYVLCAIGDSEVGVDIEEIKNKELSLADIILSAEEKKHWINISDSEKVKTFYKYWTLKESYVKYIGKGLYIPMDDLTFIKNENTVQLKINGKLEESCCFFQKEIDNEYYAALCIDKRLKNDFLFEMKLIEIEELVYITT